MGSHHKLRFWTHSGTKVYDNLPTPTSWADLDLSSVVGKNRVLAFLKLKNRNAMVGEVYWIRINGETEGVALGSTHAAMNNIGALDASHIAYFVIETDTNGIMEWFSSSGGITDVWVLGYVK